MNTIACRELAERLPDWVGGRLAPEEAARTKAHVESCAECAAEARLLGALSASQPQAPAELATRISQALRAPAGATRSAALRGTLRRLRPAWALSAAAVLVLAVGTALLQRDPAPTVAGLGEVAVEEEAGVWMADDGVVAGAPVLDDLSDDALTMLLEEMGG